MASLLLCGSTRAQQAPSAPGRPWLPRSSDLPTPADFHRTDPSLAAPAIHSNHPYTLPELVDLAEQHNPETRAVWQQARIRGAELNIARSELFPTLMAVATAATSRQGVLFASAFVRQTLGLFEPLLRVNYDVYDFGRRAERIQSAREQLLAADFAFNTQHLDILFQTARRYYRLLNTIGQQQAAALNLKNAQTVQASVEARLAVGLATLPDALEARAAAAQADYELQATIGESEIARGELLTLLGVSPTEPLEVQPLADLTLPDHMDEQAEGAIERALLQRPEIAQRVAERRAAATSIRAARSAYLPTLDFQGEGGEVRAYGQQDLLPSVYAGPVEVWNVSLNLRWTLFDGGRREADLVRAHAEEHRAEAELAGQADAVEVQVWEAYIDLQTAFRQHRAAQSLLAAARTSYDAALRSYQAGVRNTVDVVSAQRTLAQATSQDVTASTSLLTALAQLSYRTGDLLRTRTPGARP